MGSDSSPELASTAGSPVAAPLAAARDRFGLALALVLRGGVYAVATLLIAGLALDAVSGGGAASATSGSGPSALLGAAALATASGPELVLSLGLLVLLCLPLARVVLSLVFFLRQGDRLYAGLAGIVLLLVAIGVASARIH